MVEDISKTSRRGLLRLVGAGALTATGVFVGRKTSLAAKVSSGNSGELSFFEGQEVNNSSLSDLLDFKVGNYGRLVSFKDDDDNYFLTPTVANIAFSVHPKKEGLEYSVNGRIGGVVNIFPSDDIGLNIDYPKEGQNLYGVNLSLQGKHDLVMPAAYTIVDIDVEADGLKDTFPLLFLAQEQGK